MGGASLCTCLHSHWHAKLLLVRRLLRWLCPGQRCCLSWQPAPFARTAAGASTGAHVPQRVRPSARPLHSHLCPQRAGPGAQGEVCPYAHRGLQAVSLGSAHRIGGTALAALACAASAIAPADVRFDAPAPRRTGSPADSTASQRAGGREFEVRAGRSLRSAARKQGPDVSCPTTAATAAQRCRWPAAHVINFALVPPSQRILFCNIVSVSPAYPHTPHPGQEESGTGQWVQPGVRGWTQVGGPTVALSTRPWTCRVDDAGRTVGGCPQDGIGSACICLPVPSWACALGME